MRTSRGDIGVYLGIQNCRRRHPRSERPGCDVAHADTAGGVLGARRPNRRGVVHAERDASGLRAKGGECQVVSQSTGGVATRARRVRRGRGVGSRDIARRALLAGSPRGVSGHQRNRRERRTGGVHPGHQTDVREVRVARARVSRANSGAHRPDVAASHRVRVLGDRDWEFVGGARDRRDAGRFLGHAETKYSKGRPVQRSGSNQRDLLSNEHNAPYLARKARRQVLVPKRGSCARHSVCARRRVAEFDIPVWQFGRRAAEYRGDAVGFVRGEFGVLVVTRRAARGRGLLAFVSVELVETVLHKVPYFRSAASIKSHGLWNDARAETPRVGERETLRRERCRKRGGVDHRVSTETRPHREPGDGPGVADHWNGRRGEGDDAVSKEARERRATRDGNRDEQA
mmetsp:Transcript_10800/g.35680  ORF Transcript_10800/g.35680 Transcript_10800/m.35680 type:complete len:401 (-) Transcript_10800:815-2017(-)